MNGSQGSDENRNNRNFTPNTETGVTGPVVASERQKPLLEVTVDHNIEKALRVLKRKLIREGLFKELKTRRYFEKPCEKRKRKQKEAVKRTRKEEARQKKFANGLS
jgi:small subunit ribosomal protein S21